MKKMLLLCGISLTMTGCYTCGEAMDMYYRNCLSEQSDKDYCRQRASLEAQDMGYCTTTNFSYGFGLNRNY